jgi:hypothetical protein
MYPFYDDIIEPLLADAGARLVVEIGALRGDTTERMLGTLGPGAELHVIDPVPAFDPTEHETRFAGRYIFHRGLSHDVLPTLPAMDAALIDGDHNWYTVFHELRLLDGRRGRRVRRCRCCSSTTWGGRTGGATSTTPRRPSPRSFASRTTRRAWCAASRSSFPPAGSTRR